MFVPAVSRLNWTRTLLMAVAGMQRSKRERPCSLDHPLLGLVNEEQYSLNLVQQMDTVCGTSKAPVPDPSLLTMN